VLEVGVLPLDGEERLEEPEEGELALLRFRGGLVFKAHRPLYHSTLGLRAIKKKNKYRCTVSCADSCIVLPLVVQIVVQILVQILVQIVEVGVLPLDGEKCMEEPEEGQLALLRCAGVLAGVLILVFVYYYTCWYMTLGRCPLSIFCCRGTPPRALLSPPSDITLLRTPTLSLSPLVVHIVVQIVVQM